MINRIIREDPSKSDMHNRQAITPRLLWESMKDYDLYPLYILGLCFQTPMVTPKMYFTLSLKRFGFGTFKTNLLVVPSQVMHIIFMLSLTYLAELRSELTFTAMIGELWALPFLIFMYTFDMNAINKWIAWLVMTLLISWPDAHPIQVSWNSRNSNSVRLRTVSASLYNMGVQTSNIIAANIYREDDKPRYRRGNRVLVILCVSNIALYTLTKVYYVMKNKRRESIWGRMTGEEREEYVAGTSDKGNRRLDFRFAH
ncbi:MAG: hypothetical protein Q9227_005553 [Pyrenula ochraceoflavens]